MFEGNYWTRAVSRRTALRGAGIAGAGLAGAALIGCGSSSATPTTSAGGGGASTPGSASTAGAATAAAGQQPKSGGTFTTVTGSEPRSLDPAFDTFWPMRMGYNILTRFTGDLSKIEPEMTEALPEVPDDTTYVYKLKPGIKFQNVDPANGREFVAEDVKYSIQRQATDDPGKFQHAYYFKDKIADIQTPDDHTVIFKTKGAFAPFQNYISSPWTCMVNREAVEKFGDLTQHVVGTGPFIFGEWQKAVQITWKKNPDYFVSGQPYVDNIVVLLVTEPDTQATLYLDHKVDALTTTQQQLDRVKNGRSSDSQYKAVPSQFWREFRMMPTTKDKPYVKPFDDIRVREAIVRSIDKKAVLDLVYSGDGQLTKGPILPQFTNWTLNEELAGFDAKKAADLLKAAGNPTIAGPMIWATNPDADQIGEVIKQQLSKINAQIELTPMELAAYYNQTYKYDYTFSHHVPLNSPEPDEDLSAYFGRNSTYFKHYNTDIFDLIDKQAVTVDFKERQSVVQEAQKKIVQDFPMAFMFTPNVHEFLDQSVKGWWYSLDRYENNWASLWLDRKA